MPRDEAIDFFISYNHNDKDRATWVAATLEAHGYTTCIQEWDFNPGDNLVENIDVALKTSGRVLVILSENYVNSPWCRAEWTAAFLDRVGNVGVSVRSDWLREFGAACALESGIATLQVRQEEPLSYACAHV